MRDLNYYHENTYVLCTSMQVLMETIVFENLGVRVIEVPNPVKIPGVDMSKYPKLDIVVDEPDEAMCARRNSFYQELKPLYELLSYYDQYHSLRSHILHPDIYVTSKVVGIIDYEYSTTLIDYELNSYMNVRLDSIIQIDNTFEKEKKKLMYLAIFTPTTSDLHTLLKETLKRSKVFWSLMNAENKKMSILYFKQIDHLIDLANKEKPDPEALEVLRRELTRLFYTLKLNFELLGVY
ncbi:hypothetical protein JOD29_003518 [Lysinibacillus composti]|uniref:Uncharacterized protein n=1 Tax=Lysinibacillus composti TaxID=720633 RepID=A0A3N9UPI8_9BACI|nr:hypothetical protein [Lysinibacillus composti]MBM7610239.1 hypothetical protein [Lysinibacillus composti]RQW73836.1 hypothetical protein EBB45_14805 [Lysinibacillus composti]